MTSHKRKASTVCPNHAMHTEGPKGYSAWHEWAKDKAKTHEQRLCPGCGLYKIWALVGAAQ